jgi:hypothetical protein
MCKMEKKKAHGSFGGLELHGEALEVARERRTPLRFLAQPLACPLVRLVLFLHPA